MIQEKDFLYFEDIVNTIRQDYLVDGDPNIIKFNKITTLDNADDESLIWIKPTQPNKVALIKNSPAAVVVCDNSFEVGETDLQGKCLIRVNEPKEAVINLINKYFKHRYGSSIHKTVIISKGAKISGDVYIGANVFIGEDVELGKGVVIEGNSFIYEKTVIRDNAIIQAGVVIGSEGFGHFKNEKKELLHFPHIGRVVLEQDTHIGSNSVIDRGVLGDTLIGRGTKINKMCVVSHNVTIGINNFIAHSVCINGSAVIGDNNFIGSGAIIKNKVVIGHDAIVGMGAVVVSNVADKRMVMGNPAKETDRKPNKPLF